MTITITNVEPHLVEIQNKIKKYGKEVVEFFIDELVLMDGKISYRCYRDFLIKNKIIKKSTKTASAVLMKHERTHSSNYRITIRNGRNDTIFYMNFNDKELPEIIKMLE